MANSSPDQNKTPDRIKWLTDLIRLEIVLWDRIDARLRQENNLSLAFFELLYLLLQEREKSLRVGDIARKLRVTVGGTSKLVDRVERAGYIRREIDPTNRRASLIALTASGEKAVTLAAETYEAEMKAVLDGVLETQEHRQMHEMVERLLKANSKPEKEPAEGESGPV
ncbi:MAG TPA: MarR family transcriptional regulator [Chloroflexia bacterium]|nr:MarR family transcriptional regulator [Chloroflexia bacterium]